MCSKYAIIIAIIVIFVEFYVGHAISARFLLGNFPVFFRPVMHRNFLRL